MTFVQILPVADQPTGSLSSGTRNMPQGFNGATLRIDALPFTGLNHPFSDPTMEITLTTAFSWDGGTTFPESASTSAFGATGWGKNGTDDPMFSRSVPNNVALGGRPNKYRADLQVINGPITFGLSIEEL